MDWRPSADLEELKRPHIKHVEAQTAVTVKSEEDEEKPESSKLNHHTRVEEDREDWEGLEPAWNTGPGGHLGPWTLDENENSSDTEDSEDYGKERPHLNIVKIESLDTNESSVIGNAFGNNGDFGSNEQSHTGANFHAGEKSFSCSACGKSFRQKINLINHERIHTGEKPFSCSDCNKSFRQKSNLISHKRIHTGEKRFSCSECSKSFRLKNTLIDHERIHKGEKPFSCFICSKTFRQKSNLINHERIHTGEKPFSCYVCSKIFKWKSSLIQHERIHTG